MYKTLQIQISKQHKLWKDCDQICDNGKILYNKANYEIRQHLFKTEKYLGFKDLWKSIHKYEEYKNLGHSSISNQVLRDICDIWKSYFNFLKSWKIDNSISKTRPRMPKYKDKIKGRFQVCFTTSGTAPAINKKRLNKFGELCFFGKNKFKISVPEYIKEKKIKEIAIVPNSNQYLILINYIDENLDTKKLDKSKIASIDLGVNNLITLTSNVEGFKPILINGRPLKSINQYYNKKLARLKSCLPSEQYSSNKIQILTRKRNNKIKNYLHKCSKLVVQILVDNNIGILVVGYNRGWKNCINLGRKNNQKFVQIPYQHLILQLLYKFEFEGGETIINEESYTSKASFLDLDNIPTYSKKSEIQYEFSGKRVKRGLYISGDKRKINADVNASFNILRKVVPNAFSNGIEGVVVHPLLLEITV